MTQGHNLFPFFGFVYHLIFNEARRFGNLLCFLLQASKTPNLANLLDRAILSAWVVSKGSTRLGALLAWRRKQIRLPKRRVSLNIIRWAKSKKEIVSARSFSGGHETVPTKYEVCNCFYDILLPVPSPNQSNRVCPALTTHLCGSL
jgi:hypothetical protein